MADTVGELLKFLQIGARLDLKAFAVENVLGITGTDDGIKLLIEHPKLLVCLLTLLEDRNVPVSKDAALSLVNISAHEKGAESLLKLDAENNCPSLQRPPQNIIIATLGYIFDENSHIADQCCMILSNISRVSHLIETVIDYVECSNNTFDEIINVFTKITHNKHGANLHYLGPVLSNLSQSSRVRKYILDKDKCVVQRLLPFTEYKDSLVRRGGVIGTLKNCCFETDYHKWLLEDVNILPYLLLPLAGNEEFDDEDNDKLPVELQYLSEDKLRENDPDIRYILLEALTQLCSHKTNREFIREKNAYVILRELHKWEKDRKTLLACENLVDILIRTEEEIGHDNLKEIEVPADLTENFHKADEEYLHG